MPGLATCHYTQSIIPVLCYVQETMLFRLVTMTALSSHTHIYGMSAENHFT